MAWPPPTRALERGIEYANEREVFGQPIGANQAIQHPLADAYAQVLAAKHLVYNAAEQLDDAERTVAGAYANAAEYLAAEAAFAAADAAVQTTAASAWPGSTTSSGTSGRPA